MHNIVYLIGRVQEIKEIEENSAYLVLNVAYKNENNEDVVSSFNCKLWNALATHTIEYLSYNDLVGIKGRLQDNEIIIDRVSFLASAKTMHEEE